MLPNGFILLALSLLIAVPAMAGEKPFRPPSVPLVAHDPYFSIWSPADKLTDADPVHWTSQPHPLRSLVRTDGKAYRLMGTEPGDLPALPQTGLTVLPTRTIYEFADPQVAITLTFTTPLLPDDLDILARPVTYLTWQVRSLDGARHAVAIYCDASSRITVNTPEQTVVWNREQVPGLLVSRVGTERQPILSSRGDDHRIDWGYLYLAVPSGKGAQMATGSGTALRKQFAESGSLPKQDDTRMPRAASDDEPVMASVLSSEVGARPVSRHLMVAYDDLYSINYFGSRLRPYWRRNGMDAQTLLRTAEKDYPALARRCEKFDKQMVADAAKAGGEKYARICALLYRQALAGNKLAADDKGMPMLFPKENTSNGCIGTVDVIFPMSPLFLLVSPALSRAMLAPVLNYAASPRWKFPYSPHDVGCYPIATGQVYGGGERTEDGQMPVEESGDMILMIAAVAKAEGNPSFAKAYWPMLSRWAAYLKQFGMDPAHQLCTDDFAGAFAHNVNLSAKAILALGAYGWLCEQTGKAREAAEYKGLASDYARRWIKMADDGDHTRLAFDQPGTWSQKYNLVWDRILGLNLFPREILQREAAYYRKIANPYGVPLDSRNTFAKLDWSIWGAALSGERDDFEALVDPIYAFLDQVPQRNPVTDLYWTQNGQETAMHARPVVGGGFIRFLQDPELWKRWAAQGAKSEGKWAPLPKPIPVKTLVPTAQAEPIAWRYTFEKPADGWFHPEFDDSAWNTGPAGFGIQGTPGSVVRTTWSTPDIWIRREFDLPAGKLKNPRLLIHHDEDAEVYINGVLAAQTSGYVVSYEEVEISPEARKALRPGENTFAVHCHQTVGGQYIDIGIVDDMSPVAGRQQQT